MKAKILNLCTIAVLLVGIIGCIEDSNKTYSTIDNNDESVLPKINSTANGINIPYALSNNTVVSQIAAPVVKLQVGVNHEVCKKILPKGSVKYVSTQGDDNSADGSLTKPYKTVFKAVAEARAGDMIMIRGGTYVETGEIRVRVPNVTITSYPNEWAIIDRSSATHVGSEDSGIYLDVDSDGSTVECLEVKGGLYAISTETKWDWDEADKMGATNLTITNVKAHDSYADVVRVKPNSDNFKISYSEIYNSGIGQNPNECNAEGIDNVNSDNMIASHLYIHNICSNGIYFKGGASNGVIEYSVVENTGEGGIMLGFDTSPEYFDLSANPDYYESLDCTAHHNLVKNAKGAGIGFYASKNARVYNNTIVNSSTRFHAPLYFGITFQDWDANAKRPANINPFVHNNIVAQTSIYDKPLVAIRYSDELGGLSGLSGSLDIDNNCYYQQDKAGLAMEKAKFEDGRNGGWQGDFSQWQIHIGNDKNSKEIDPQLDANGVAHNPECRLSGYTN